MKSTGIDRMKAERSIDVDHALALVRRAVADCNYTLDALEAEMKKDRAYIHKVLQGEKPMTLEFIIALPDDVEARFEELRAECFGLLVVKPLTGLDAQKAFVAGLVGIMSAPSPMALPAKADAMVKATLAPVAKAGTR